MLPIQGIYCCPVSTRWGFKWGVPTWFIWGAQSGFTVISGVSWGISAWGGSLAWSVMMVMRSAGVTVLWSAPVVASLMWPGVTLRWVIMAVTSISMRVQLLPWPTISIPVPMMMPRSGSGEMPCAWVLSLMACRHAWWWYPIWAVCCYMSVLIAFKTLHIWAMTGNVA